MHRVLSTHLWQEIATVAAEAKQRQAAIAYVTLDLIGFRGGDVLVVDASPFAIGSGETNAKLLAALLKKGVALYSCPCLHAKVLLMDGVAVVGSGNMSKSSRSKLVEAALMTDSSTVVSGVASLIGQLVTQSSKLGKEAIDKLCKIEVVRHGGGGGGPKEKRPKIAPLGNRSWLIGVSEEAKLTDEENELVAQATKTIAAESKRDADDVDWIRWGGSGPFALTCQTGDQLIQIWRQSAKDKHPSVVLKVVPVLLRKRTTRATFVFLGERKGKNAEISWGAFKALMKKLGCTHTFGPNSQRILNPELAEAITRSWSKV